MRTRQSRGVGSASLVLIFVTLCLSIFAVLSLSDAVGQQKTADLLAEATTAYYRADTEATRVMAALADALREGEAPETLHETAVAKTVAADGIHYTYSVAVSEEQILAVELLQTEETLTILQWAQTPRSEWDGDESIPLPQ